MSTQYTILSPNENGLELDETEREELDHAARQTQQRWSKQPDFRRILVLIQSYSSHMWRGGKTSVRNREAKASICSRITFWWLNAIIWLGFKKPLEMDDIDELQRRDRVEYILQTVDKEVRMFESQGKKLKLWRVFYRTMKTEVWCAFFLKLAADMLMFVGPFGIDFIISFTEDPATAWFGGKYFGYIVVVAMFMAQIGSSLCTQLHSHIMIRQGIHFRSVIISLVYRKSLSIPAHTKQDLTEGKITTMMSVDSHQVMTVLYFLQYLWTAPIQIGIALYLLINFLGYGGAIAVAIMACMAYIPGRLVRFLRRISRQILRATDKRVGLVTEVIQGIRIIKYYAWQESYFKLVGKIRENEIYLTKWKLLYRAGLDFILQAMPGVVALSAFYFYTVFNDTTLTASVAFTSLSLLNILRMPLTMMPIVIALCVDGKVSLERVQTFISLDDIPRLGPPNTPKGTIKVEDTSYRWNPKLVRPTIRGVSLHVTPAKLVMVTGRVGAGKSTLLNGLLGELVSNPPAEHSALSGKVAYVSQVAWIMNMTLQDNVLFGKPLDETKYRRCIDAAALTQDLEMLPGGDQTEIGERGINLSGGQKQRVNIARALYTDADIYIFDDPFSALDRHTCDHVFEHAILDYLHDKTVIFATHQIHYITHADQVINMDEYALDEVVGDMKEEKDGVALSPGTINPGLGESKRSKRMKEKSIRVGDGEAVPAKHVAEVKKSRKRVAGALQSKELRLTGAVSLSVYWHYVKACGIFASLTVLFTLTVSQGIKIGTDYWLNFWSVDQFMQTTGFYVMIYAILTATAVALIGFVDLLAVYVGIWGATSIHDKMLKCLLAAPVSFFDTTPVGRIVNRLSKDTNAIDQQLSITFRSYLERLVNFVGVIIVIGVIIKYLGLFMLPVILVFATLQQFYRRTSRELKRLDSISKSPIFAHFSETLNGLQTIRAFDDSHRFLRTNWERIDKNVAPFWMSQCVDRWLGTRLDFLASFVLLFAGFAVLVYQDYFSAELGLIGLILTYSLSMTQSLNYLVRQAIQTEVELNAVERTTEYSSIDPEGLPVTQQPPPEWPDRGQIAFNNVSARYRVGLPLVLKDIKLEIQGGAKIGICGRTGSGKSTMMALLFRIIELAQGSIVIDGINISEIDILLLRTKIAIIPQDPVLFQGTIKTNLDPFSQYTDAGIWEALTAVQLDEVVKNVEGGSELDSDVGEGGDKFSVGQRQLFCMARALLRKNKILVLDEATASVDYTTDKLIQDMLRTQFTHCTVLTIAHRVDTIMDYDRIVVLEDSRLIEFDTPDNLMSNPDSTFSSLVRSEQDGGH